MIVRLVKMEFKPEEIENFKILFEGVKEHIRSFEGCKFLELLNGTDNKTIFFTHSYWESAEALETYRKSELFKTTWARTKVLFNAKPEAWSVEKFVTLQ
ncbi:putative quinol monooxygenase [Leeuwenhoekiella sp. NPDC079379]|uniref:putative quinol monooxygenase n=1 Tax=Leeuwenhoekiella sp. NPDC079379 TaxID=3364122 RepID=UPI0037C87112